MKTKVYAILLFSIAVTMLSASTLGMFIDVKRFFDVNDNTKFVIDYQIPYKNLVFLSSSKVFFAEMKVSISISNSDSVLVSKEFVNNIGVTNKNDTMSSYKSYLDRISVVFSKPGYKIDISFEDINSKKTFNWEYEADLLSRMDMLSDIEILSKVTADTSSVSPKFIRQHKAMIPEPSYMISKDKTDSAFVYVEYKPSFNSKTQPRFKLSQIKPSDQETTNDLSELVIQDNISMTHISPMGYILFPINIRHLEKGRYQGQIEIIDSLESFSRVFEFSLIEPFVESYSVFGNPEDDILLVKYISPGSYPANWKGFSKDAKKNYITSFWIELANAKRLSVAEVISLYKEKIDFCNKRYSHFEKGWKSDMGRIFLRNGTPSDIEKDRTTDDTRYVRKDFQIWKYSNLNHAIYIFVDIQMNGNYKLVYAVNDDNESTNPDWRKYLGSDFDESLIENWIFKNTQD